MSICLRYTFSNQKMIIDFLFGKLLYYLGGKNIPLI